jgi:hypothetical protein
VAEEVIKQMHLGEPDIKPHAAFLLILHETQNNALSVISASGVRRRATPLPPYHAPAAEPRPLCRASL